MEIIQRLLNTTSKQRMLIILVVSFIISLYNQVAFEFYSVILAPIILSYIFSGKVAETVFLVHRGFFPILSKKKAEIKYLKPINKYYRFALSYKVNIFELLKFTFYPFLFYMGMTIQRKTIYSNLLFPIWFVLLTAMMIIDKSGLRYVNVKDQSIQKLGFWYLLRLRGLLSIFVSFSFLVNIFLIGNIIDATAFILRVSSKIYLQIFAVSLLYVIIVLPANRKEFLKILTSKYGITQKTVEISLVERPVYH